MKRWTMILCVCLIFAAFIQPALAADDQNAQNAAEVLYALELFRGTTNGFDLNSIPTRAQITTMLVRFLGLEQDALAGTYGCPFSDVPEDAWYYPYVAYAYAQGFTAGTDATHFSGEQAATRQQYAALLLRALGHSVDYESAVLVAEQAGIFLYVDSQTGPFTRADMVLMSYGALTAPRAEDGVTLLQRLIDTGILSFEQVSRADFTSVSLVGDPIRDPLMGETAVSAGGRAMTIGMDADELLSIAGTPDRIDPSVYPFEWYVYNSKPSAFFMAGVQNGRVVAFYSNSPGASAGNCEIGKAPPEKELFSESLAFTVFLDASGALVEGILLLPKSADASDLTPEILSAMELQALDLANASRAANGKAPFSWSVQAAVMARYHSVDMSTRGYFGHTDPDGNDLGARMARHNLPDVAARENIAQGYSSVFGAHHAWMCSESHKKSLLGDYTYSGTGITENLYYTSLYYKI